MEEKEKEIRKKLFLERGPANCIPCSDLCEEDNKSDKQNKGISFVRDLYIFRKTYFYANDSFSVGSTLGSF